MNNLANNFLLRLGQISFAKQIADIATVLDEFIPCQDAVATTCEFLHCVGTCGAAIGYEIIADRKDSITCSVECEEITLVCEHGHVTHNVCKCLVCKSKICITCVGKKTRVCETCNWDAYCSDSDEISTNNSRSPPPARSSPTPEYYYW